MKYLIIILLLFACGCTLITINTGISSLPKLKKPDRPNYVLPELDSELTDRERALIRSSIEWKRYSEKLEVVIDEYNDYASNEQ